MEPERGRAAALAALFGAILLLTNVIVKRETLVIVVPGEERIVVRSPLMYGWSEVVLIALASAVVGFSLATLILWSRSDEGGGRRAHPDLNDILKLLDERDREVVKFFMVRGGEALQSEIWSELGMKKVTASRRLDGLETRGLVVREKVGGTYRVRLTEWLARLAGIDQENP